MSYLITATSEGDHIRVEVHQSCIVEWSDDGINWRALNADQFTRESSGPVFRDYAVPLGESRSYRASTGGSETISVTQHEPGYVPPTLEEIKKRLAAVMHRDAEVLFRADTP